MYENDLETKKIYNYKLKPQHIHLLNLAVQLFNLKPFINNKWREKLRFRKINEIFFFDFWIIWQVVFSTK